MESPDMAMYNTVLDRFPHLSMYGEGLYGIFCYIYVLIQF